jgi:anti-sigma factor RsiW
MSHDPDLLECTDEAARLLPWFVNGTLSSADAARVATHLEHCRTCRADVAEQGRVRALMRAPAQVEYAPQAGFRKLLTRVNELEREDLASVSKAIVPEPRTRFAGGPVRWLSAAVVVQALALGAIAGARFLGSNSDDGTQGFRTLTSVAAEGARLRVVFVPATTLAELQELLRANQLVAIAGPSDAGIFTLALRSPAASQEAQVAVLARLRADPRVRFAEPLGLDAPAR